MGNRYDIIVQFNNKTRKDIYLLKDKLINFYHNLLELLKYRISNLILLKCQIFEKKCQYFLFDKSIIFKYEKTLKKNQHLNLSYNYLWKIACLYNKYERYDEALKTLELLINKIPKEKLKDDDTYSRIYSLIAYCEHYTGNSKKAIDILENLLKNENNSNKFGNYVALSKIYRDISDVKKAYSYIFKTIPFLNEKLLFPFFIEISLLFFEEKNNLSRRAYEIAKILKRRNLSYKTTNYIAQEISKIAEESNKPELYNISLFFYKKILKAKNFKPNKSFYYYIALSYFGVHDFKNAKKYITLGLKFKNKFNDDYNYYSLMSLILANLGKYKLSQKILETLLENKNLYKSQIYYNLIICFYNSNQLKKAREYIEKALILNKEELSLNNEQISKLKKLQKQIKE